VCGASHRHGQRGSKMTPSLCVNRLVRALLTRVARDYGLDKSSLVAKYMPRHQRARKVVYTLESLDLSAPLPDSVVMALHLPVLRGVCKHHGLFISGSRSKLVERVLGFQTDPTDPRWRRTRNTVPRSKRHRPPPPPLHNHAPDSLLHGDCEHCRTHGNVLWVP